MKLSNNVAFLDILFNLLLVFVFFFVVQLNKINADQKKKTVESKAEFTISMTWPDDLYDDVDMYVDDPHDNLCSFRRTHAGLMHLERDDTGIANDTIRGPNGQVYKVENNKEIVFLRGTFNGKYHISAHLYAKRDPNEEIDPDNIGIATEDDPREIPVTITIEKLNPYKVVYTETKVLRNNKEEKFYCSFDIKDNEVVKVDTELEISLINKHLNRRPHVRN